MFISFLSLCFHYIVNIGRFYYALNFILKKQRKRCLNLNQFACSWMYIVHISFVVKVTVPLEHGINRNDGKCLWRYLNNENIMTGYNVFFENI